MSRSSKPSTDCWLRRSTSMPTYGWKWFSKTKVSAIRYSWRVGEHPERHRPGLRRLWMHVEDVPAVLEEERRPMRVGEPVHRPDRPVRRLAGPQQRHAVDRIVDERDHERAGVGEDPLDREPGVAGRVVLRPHRQAVRGVEPEVRVAGALRA